jgi:hypothetical protein
MHPPRFRQRFAEEMLGIFDEAHCKFAAARLVLDGIASLARQWILRSEFWEQPIAEVETLRSSGAPAFYTFDRFQPRNSALMQGTVLSLAIFCAVCFIMKYGVNHAVYMPFASIVSEGSGHESVTRAKPTALSQESAPPTPGQNQRRADALNQEQNKIAAKLHRLLMQAAPAPAAKRGAPRAEVRGLPAPRKNVVPDAAVPVSSPARQASAAIFISKQILESYVGTYVLDSPDRATVSISMTAGELALETGGKQECALTVISENRFAVCNKSDLWIEFLLQGSGMAQQIIIHDADREIRAQRR